MNINFDGKVAIVTGAGGGLGRCHALDLAKRGAKVVVNDLGGNVDGSDDGSLSAAEKVVEEIKAAGGEAMSNGASVTDVAQVEEMVKQTMDAYGRIDILINNAGILRDKSFSKVTDEDFRMVLEVHLMGTVNCTKAVWEIMKEQNYGRIVVTSSSSGLYGNFGQANYGAAKAGIAGFTRSLSFEMAKYKCTVNTISPGAATRMTIDLIKAAGRDVDVNDWKQGPQQLAPVITWLCCDEASDVTNQIIHVQNGTVGIMQQPAVIESFLSEELWSLDQLDRVIGNLVETKKNHDSEVQKKAEPKKS